MRGIDGDVGGEGENREVGDVDKHMFGVGDDVLSSAFDLSRDFMKMNPEESVGDESGEVRGEETEEEGGEVKGEGGPPLPKEVVSKLVVMFF